MTDTLLDQGGGGGKLLCSVQHLSCPYATLQRYVAVQRWQLTKVLLYQMTRVQHVDKDTANMDIYKITNRSHVMGGILPTMDIGAHCSRVDETKVNNYSAGLINRKNI